MSSLPDADQSLPSRVRQQPQEAPLPGDGCPSGARQDVLQGSTLRLDADADADAGADAEVQQAGAAVRGVAEAPSKRFVFAVNPLVFLLA